MKVLKSNTHRTIWLPGRSKLFKRDDYEQAQGAILKKVPGPFLELIYGIEMKYDIINILLFFDNRVNWRYQIE